MEEENKNLVEPNENDNTSVEKTNGTVNLKVNRAGKALSILSIIFGVLAIILSSITLAMCIDAKLKQGTGDTTEAVGAGFGLIFQFLFSIPALGLSVVSLGLGIASIPTSKTKPAKILAIIATIIASAASIILLVAFLASFVIK